MKSKLIGAVLGLSVAASGLSQAADVPFDFEVLQFRAKALAAKPYEPRASRVPKRLAELTYDQYRFIRFNGDKAWWRREKLPFQLQFFHPGFIYTKTVQVNEVNQGKVQPIEFSSDFFQYGKEVDFGQVPHDMGFTGFRVHYPLNTPAIHDELAVFQGASYFRALGQQMRYGLSARGLALNTGEPGGEEFPSFEEFYIQKPAGDAKEILVYALMDSPSVAGAYAFTIKPGAATVMHVKGAVYVRGGAQIKSFGVAPLTSMFWYAENSGTTYGDMRPEVHDSDGLMIEHGSGEWLWRPLQNPNAVRVLSFNDENPRGFGLVQRDRRFENYEDLEAAYHLRPSTWVQPVGQWGKGAIRLVEIPTPDETNDNIVAFWVPEKLPATGEPVRFEYNLHWFLEQTGGKRPPAGYVVNTRLGRSKTHEQDLQRFWIDFDGTYLRGAPPKTPVEAVITAGSGATIVHHTVEKNAFNNTWRVAFALKPDGSGKPVELRCFLKREPHILTETWSYLWTP
jgi:periplasmic glucans biosynthesis protein